MYNWMEAIYLTGTLLIASLAIFLTGIFVQKEKWITIDAIMMVVYGSGFAIFPGQFLSYQTTGTLKSTEIALARVYGATVLGTSVMWLWTHETRDATVPINIIMSRVFTSSMLLVGQAFACQAGATTSKSGATSDVKWIEQFAVMSMVPTFLWLLGNLYHLLWHSNDFSTYPQHNTRLNNNLRIDAWLQLLIGAILIAFPAQVINAIMTSPGGNKISLHVARSTGILCIGEAILALQAPGFLHVRDKQAIFVTRITSVALQLVAVSFSAFLGVVAQTSLCWVIGLSTPLLINSLIGLFTDGPTIYHVPPSTTASSPEKVKSH